MAYPTVSKPYGLQPINLIGGQVFAGATRYRRIASAYATAIFYGDLVKLTTDGTVVLANEIIIISLVYFIVIKVKFLKSKKSNSRKYNIVILTNKI